MGILGSLFGKKKMTAAETAFIKRQSQIFADCIRIIADTTDIETYFYRYGLAEQTVAQIAEVAGGDTKCMAGGKKSQGIAAIVDEYAAQMPEESLKHGQELCDKMIEKIEKVVNK